MKNKLGFTIPELMVSMAVASILTVVMFTVTIYFYADILRQQAIAEMAVESQSVLRRLVEDIRTANSIQNTNSLPDANAPPGGWQTSDPNNVMIIASPAYDSTRQIIYNPVDNFPYQNEVIYFGSGSTIARRTIQNTQALGNTLLTSCPEALVTSTCPADITLSKYLDNLTFIFYDINNQVTAVAADTRSISITLRMKRKIHGRDVVFDNTIRTTLRNY
ncbi:MAG: prepilin-type N-terminal cleavage/methylation domain-containing protein [bacterium]|nr:prepilin-type N-terminal cleavage/methylation domain-containing protein [bacterium]